MHEAMNMEKIVILLLILCISVPVFAGGPVLPDEWRMPTDQELSDNWRTGKYKNAMAVGDFNGDGLIEGAFIVVSKDGKWEGLIAFVYLPNKKEQWFVLDKNELYNTVFMGLDLYKPGKYKVLCETESECKQGYKKEITGNL